MYLLSSLIGYLLGGAMLLLGARFRHPVRELVETTARRHADDAAGKRGPYLSPITFAVALIVLTALGAVLIHEVGS